MKSFLRNVCGKVKKEIEEEIDEALSGGRNSGQHGGEGRSTAFSTEAGGGIPGLGALGGGAGGGGMDMLQGLMGLVSGGGGGGGAGAGGQLSNLISGFTSGGGGKSGGSSALTTIINLIQSQSGGTGLLPASVGKYLPMILKLAEMLGHGMGDDSPRTEKNSDGSFIDTFIKTIIGGRKIFGGGGGDDGKKIFKPVPKGGGTLPDIDYSNVSPSAQDYEAIKNECLQAGALWEDPEFPAENASVFFSESERRRFTWLRPHELCSNPSFFVEGASRFDVNQGELGDCWLLAALANLTLNEKLFYQVVPEDNSFENGYAGVFHFRFWQYGQWVDVVIDDRLPTVDGKLMFLHSEDCNEFWSALLEKAYAKLYGSYESLKGGTTCEALEDFTGGITELYDLNTAPKNLFNMIQRAFERSSFLGCSIEPDPRVTEALTPSGLVRGHAYSITDVKIVDGTQLLRIKNPWGNEVEWKGAWSDGSPEWNQIDDETKEDIGLCFDSDGEFWMSFTDFMKYFDRVEFCNLSPDSLDEDLGRKWHLNIFEGAWKAGQSAGGCRNYIDTFANNPQYIIDLEEPDESEGDGKCTFIIALMQKNRRARRKYGVECLTIGFAIYKLNEDLPAPLPMEFFKFNPSVARSPTFINLREVCSRFRLAVGRYVIVPSTFEPNEEGEFIIRVFTEGRSEMIDGGN